MHSFVEITLLLLALLGHLALSVALVNRIHSVLLPKPLKVCLSLSSCLTLLLIPTWLFPEHGTLVTSVIAAGTWWPLVYLVPFCSLGIHVLIQRAYRVAIQHERHPVLVSNHTSRMHVEEAVGRPLTGNFVTRLLSKIPGNQYLELHVHEKTIQLPRSAPALDGLSIAHLTDPHINTRLDVNFYRELVEQTNALQPDLIVLTGDLFDEEACLDWIPETLARLTAPAGVYFILGNHDLRVDHARVRRLLCEAGLIDLGGSFQKISLRGRPFILAGNELPWFSPAADLRHCPVTGTHGRLPRILLAHSPDQIDWARRGDFDLMLAGHTHGGQIRLPVAGPILSPSRLGTRYSAGTFYLEPTVMHVSRGISSLTPLRFNCPPELALLRLQCPVPLVEEESQRDRELSPAL